METRIIDGSIIIAAWKVNPNTHFAVSLCSRRTYVDNPNHEFITYNHESKQFCGRQLNPRIIPDKHVSMFAALMTSTTPFSFSGRIIIIYSRLQIWTCDLLNEKSSLVSQPLMLDHQYTQFSGSHANVSAPYTVSIKGSHLIAHKYRNAIYVRDFNRESGFVLLFPTCVRIVEAVLSYYTCRMLLYRTDTETTYYYSHSYDHRDKHWIQCFDSYKYTIIDLGLYNITINSLVDESWICHDRNLLPLMTLH